jgi:uncharacterized protein YecT (DUF1311 family)
MGCMRRQYALKLILLLAFSALCSSNCSAQHMNAVDAPCHTLKPNELEVHCFIVASQVADRRLNEFYKKVYDHLGPEDQKRLQAAQRLWIQFRDQNCGAEYELYEGGNAGPTVRAACIEADTRQRTAELKIMYSWIMDK